MRISRKCCSASMPSIR
ncbi:hypothetical protein QTG54_008155 [Skeletonema marinoi]|uniref:Uncharacterized protein n=1 Tax=Skeletonema marinoi TaxID=267567 RepID=A0AAD8Y796_9STRA|nr:hypothetical protein QTG54_008155 [Skeletonema marinoi]